jgi:hypothetical protein
MAQAQDIELEQSVVEKLGFGSIESMRTQLNNWDVPDWITQGIQAVEKPKRLKPAITPRRARSSGPPIELPPASNAASLFREKLELLERATDDLKHRVERLQGERYVQSAVHNNPGSLSREFVSEGQRQHLREVFGFEPENPMHFGGATFSLGGGTSAPQAPLPALISAYLLAGGDVEPLVEALHHDPESVDRQKLHKRIEGRKGTDGLDGLKALAEQIAKAVRGGTVRTGSPAAELSSHEINLASRITKLREEDWPDEDIYQKLRSLDHDLAKNLSWEDFQRLANLKIHFPFPQRKRKVRI